MKIKFAFNKINFGLIFLVINLSSLHAQTLSNQEYESFKNKNNKTIERLAQIIIEARTLALSSQSSPSIPTATVIGAGGPIGALSVISMVKSGANVIAVESRTERTRTKEIALITHLLASRTKNQYISLEDNEHLMALSNLKILFGKSIVADLYKMEILKENSTGTPFMVLSELEMLIVAIQEKINSYYESGKEPIAHYFGYELVNEADKLSKETGLIIKKKESGEIVNLTDQTDLLIGADSAHSSVAKMIGARRITCSKVGYRILVRQKITPEMVMLWDKGHQDDDSSSESDTGTDSDNEDEDLFAKISDSQFFLEKIFKTAGNIQVTSDRNYNSITYALDIDPSIYQELQAMKDDPLGRKKLIMHLLEKNTFGSDDDEVDDPQLDIMKKRLEQELEEIDQESFSFFKIGIERSNKAAGFLERSSSKNSRKIIPVFLAGESLVALPYYSNSSFQRATQDPIALSYLLDILKDPSKHNLAITLYQSHADLSFHRTNSILSQVGSIMGSLIYPVPVPDEDLVEPECPPSTLTLEKNPSTHSLVNLEHVVSDAVDDIQCGNVIDNPDHDAPPSRPPPPPPTDARDEDTDDDD